VSVKRDDAKIIIDSLAVINKAVFKASALILTGPKLNKILPPGIKKILTVKVNTIKKKIDFMPRSISFTGTFEAQTAAAIKAAEIAYPKPLSIKQTIIMKDKEAANLTRGSNLWRIESVG
jgi:hypothetical protein